MKKKEIRDSAEIQQIFESVAFAAVEQINSLSLIYDEDKRQCNVLVFDILRACDRVAAVFFVGAGQIFDRKFMRVVTGGSRKYPIFLFVDSHGNYLFEVRYGAASANALQRGLWTNTQQAQSCFVSVTDGWVEYSANEEIVRLFSLALVATPKAHSEAQNVIEQDIERQKE